MKKVLLAIDNTQGSLKAAETLVRLFPCVKPETVIVLYVEKLEGFSLMDDALLSVSEMNELKESLKGTDYQSKLDEKAKKVTDHFVGFLKENGISGVQPVVKQGHPADEILETASDGVELIVLGARDSSRHGLLMGSISREVVNRSEIPVLIAK
ncbi:MAG: universal stress protein [Nitrospirota bacterium]|nr:MAG: universal stress protein [Nitrospirota bacterium]